MDAASLSPDAHFSPDEIPVDPLDGLLRQIIGGFFVLTDGQGALSKWSETAELLFGHEASDILGQPFFGTLVEGPLSAAGEHWRAFLEQAEPPRSPARVDLVARNDLEETRFPVEMVFVPVKLDEGFDFSLFLEDLGFELPMNLMLLRMRQQHPVVMRALRAALSEEPQPWEGWRTAGTLVAFRPLAPTPWVQEELRRREEEKALADAELEERITETDPGIQGSLHDLDDAAAVVARMVDAFERIEVLERTTGELDSRVADLRQPQGGDPELLARLGRLEIQRADDERRLEEQSIVRGDLAGRMEGLERLHAAGAEALQSRLTAALDQASAEAEIRHAELRARLERLEGDQAEALKDEIAELRETLDAAATARADATAGETTELRDRLAALEHGAAEAAELSARLERLEVAAGERPAVDEDELRERLANDVADRVAGDVGELRERLAGLESSGELGELRDRIAGDVGELRDRLAGLESSGDVGELRDRVAGELAELRERVEGIALDRSDAPPAEDGALRERVEAIAWEITSMQQQLARGSAAAGDLDALRQRVHALESADIEARIARATDDLGYRLADVERAAGEDRGRVEELTRALQESDGRADQLRAETATAAQESADVRARLQALEQEGAHARADVDGLRRDSGDLRGAIDELRGDREEARAALRDTVRRIEELQRELDTRPAAPAEPAADAPLGDEARAELNDLRREAEGLRVRLDAMGDELSGAVRRADEAHAEAASARHEAGEAREEAREDLRAVRERVDLVDRGAGTVLDEVRVMRDRVEELAGQARSAQESAVAARGEAGSAREAIDAVGADAAAARELAETSHGAAESLRELAEGAHAQAGDAREAAEGARASADAAQQRADGADHAAQSALEQAGAARDAAGEARLRAEEAHGHLGAVREKAEFAIAAAERAEALGEALDAVRETAGQAAADASAVKEAAHWTQATAEGARAAADAAGATADAAKAAADSATEATHSLTDRVDTLDERVTSLDVRMTALADQAADAGRRLDAIGEDVGRVQEGLTVAEGAVHGAIAEDAVRAEAIAGLRADADQARANLDEARTALSVLREEAEQARALATEQSATGDALEALRAEVVALRATLAEYRTGFDEARQAAVSARREAEEARRALDSAGPSVDAGRRLQEAFHEVLARTADSAATPAMERRSLKRAPKKEPPPKRAPRAGFDDQPRPMAVLDLGGHFKELNPAFAKLVGYEEHEFAKAVWPSVHDRGTLQAQQQQLAELAAGDLEAVDTTSTYLHGQGLMVLVSGTIKVVRDALGTPSHLLLEAEDRQAER